MVDQVLVKRRSPAWTVGIIIVVVVLLLIFSPARSLVQRFIESLRVQKVQQVNVDLSSFVGANADQSLQQMVRQMISEKVTVTASGTEQQAPTAAAAGQMAGFPVRLVGKRKDSPQLTVQGERAFNMAVDRDRLQAIFKEAGHPELVLPQSLAGATLAVQIPPAVKAQYGNCPSAATTPAEVTGAPPISTQFSDCLILEEGPRPTVNVPAGLNVGQLAEIALELAGMTASQAHDFFQAVDWKSTLGLSLPRTVRSYQVVDVKGSRGTILNTPGRHGPSYTLVWVDGGMAYSLAGYGNAADALPLAESLN
jgi:hypothetical protein